MPTSLTMRTYFSSYHLWAARHFAALTKVSEKEVGKVPRFDIKHRAYVTNCILSGVAFVEAAINELLQDVHDGHEAYIETLDIDGKCKLSVFWRTHRKKQISLMVKYQKVLELLAKEEFKPNEWPYVEMESVTRLRNALVHYKPKSLGAEIEYELGKRLKGSFSDNKLMDGSGNPWFPDKCLGYGCAEWVIHSAIDFVDEFFYRIGVKPNYQRVRFEPLPDEV